MCILKVEPARFADVGCEKKRERSRMVSRFLNRRNERKTIAIYRSGGDCGKNRSERGNQINFEHVILR